MAEAEKIPIRIVLLDKHTLVRNGLKYMIESQPDMKVVGEAGNLNEGLEIINSKTPDIILMGIYPEVGLNLEIIPDLMKANGRAHVILVTGLESSDVYLKAVQYGAMGVVLKTQPQEVLIKAIRKVNAGEAWIERSLIANLLTSITQGHKAPSEDPMHERIMQLSERERQIIHLIGRGLKNQQIANHLCISETTVRHHLTSIYSKLDVSDRLELLVFAQRFGLTKNSPL
jgi:two-component system, NarL family, nitrate/nitrite response regulator NarL